MTHAIRITKPADKQLSRLADPVQSRIRKAIFELASNPRPNGCKKLKGHADLYRIRIGDYRVVYSVEDAALLILVVKVGDRKDIYD